MTNISSILSQIDMQLVVGVLGMRDAGYYANYISIINIPFIFLGPMIQFLTPVISHIDGVGEHTRIATIKTFAVQYLAPLGIMTGGFFMVAGPTIATILFGDSFRMSGVILMGSALFIVFNMLLQVNFQILAGTGRVASRIRMLLVTLAVNVSLSLIALYALGLGALGVSMAVGLSWIVLWGMSEHVTRDIRADWHIRSLTSTLVAIAMLDGVVWYGLSMVSGHGWLRDIFWVGVLGIIHIMVVVLVNIREARALIRKIRR